MKSNRGLAWIIDVILISGLTTLVCTIAGIPVRFALGTDGMFEDYFNKVALINVLVGSIYFLTDVLNNGSPGKKIVGIDVVREKNDQNRVLTAILRALVKTISVYLLIGAVVFAVTNERFSLHDWAAGTVVRKAASSDRTGVPLAD